jgi:hypothetical protein
LLLADLIPRAVHNHYHPYLNCRRHQHYLQYRFALKIFSFWLLRRLGAVGMGVHHQDQCFRLIDCQRIFQSMKCWNEENRRVNKHYQENILASYFTPKKKHYAAVSCVLWEVRRNLHPKCLIFFVEKNFKNCLFPIHSACTRAFLYFAWYFFMSNRIYFIILQTHAICNTDHSTVLTQNKNVLK